MYPVGSLPLMNLLAAKCRVAKQKRTIVLQAHGISSKVDSLKDTTRKIQEATALCVGLKQEWWDAHLQGSLWHCIADLKGPIGRRILVTLSSRSVCNIKNNMQRAPHAIKIALWTGVIKSVLQLWQINVWWTRLKHMISYLFCSSSRSPPYVI